MRTLICRFLLSLSVVLTAAVASAKIADFNALIDETRQSQIELQAKLQKEAGINLKGSKPGTIAKESIEIPNTAEQVASTSHIAFSNQSKPVHINEKIGMKRVSQELKDLNN